MRWDVPAQQWDRKKGANSSFVCLSFYLGSQRNYSHPHWGGQSTLLSSLILNGNLIQKHPNRHIKKWCLIWVLLGPLKLTHEINHHKSTFCQLGTHWHLVKLYLNTSITWLPWRGDKVLEWYLFFFISYNLNTIIQNEQYSSSPLIHEGYIPRTSVDAWNHR